MVKKSSFLPWAGAIIVVGAVGYFFMKKGATQPTSAPQNLFYQTSTVSQAIENVGSKRGLVRARAGRRRFGRIPKIEKARSI